MPASPTDFDLSIKRNAAWLARHPERPRRPGAAGLASMITLLAATCFLLGILVGSLACNGKFGVGTVRTLQVERAAGI
ncbi:hypothetical protein [Defluviimonas salinarum]|uniref:Uncharacterized protein n=1 Tax=Defluviimonas salinarum TaxID=2992147 RepID=A0ABT3J559_9RHOB|nr:hypothetical protein [Defluviimonas salinarum]MCW3782544.1 hypothetical protein [Defluviimonas salinarum]